MDSLQEAIKFFRRFPTAPPANGVGFSFVISDSDCNLAAISIRKSYDNLL
jgi:hypothetical protein